MRNQLAHPGREIRGILRDQYDLHGVPLTVHAVTVFLEPLQVIDRRLVDLLTAGPTPPAFVNHRDGAVRNQLGQLRIVQRIQRQLGNPPAVDLGEQIRL
ncbi:hypothetical protein D9M68_860170 [compost metagenome]